MKAYVSHHPWKIIEEGFSPDLNMISESIFSLGNGRMGQRANFEEHYSGDSLQGNYIAGVYYPDKTRVGWWKNGYPEYFAKVLNAADWAMLDIYLEGERLDLASCEISGFIRVLDMKEGLLQRSFSAKMKNGSTIHVDAERFCSIANDELGLVKYKIRSENFKGKVEIRSGVNFDVRNQDSNYDEIFWEPVSHTVDEKGVFITARTKKTFFEVCAGADTILEKNGAPLQVGPRELIDKEMFGVYRFVINMEPGEDLTVFKYASVTSSFNHPKPNLPSRCVSNVQLAKEKGYEELKSEHIQTWAEKWEKSDILIEGDLAAQQAIRFNIFQMNQTYTGEDDRLNIGPKGFTGEKYGGSTYWDTEAYCLWFYLATADPSVARNLLIYRYKHLQKAIENAEKLGFKDGAALYPMVTINGEECHNEWEITFEEIHRNGAIAFAIYNYISHTDDWDYLGEYGLEVLVGISRFWSQRIHFSEAKQQYVMLGVTGPNEYDNNVNNNWYTNLMAVWTLRYTQEALQYVKKNAPERYQEITKKIKWKEKVERERWKSIIENMHFPEEKEKGIFLQQEGYMDKEQVMATDIPAEEVPIHEHWSWDRILRSCFIKQPDVLLGLYFFEENYDMDTLRRNFDFYEPRTVHESSLSPCIHSILAAKLGKKEKAYEMYLRTARLDLDDYNNDTDDGLHITSMAGTWMAVVQGFGGMRVKHGKLSFAPSLPGKWKRFSFKIVFKGSLLNVVVGKSSIQVENLSDVPASFQIGERTHSLNSRAKLSLNYQSK